MKIITVSHVTPKIIQSFSPFLISTPIFGTVEYYDTRLKKILKLAEKKIRKQDIGKKREFDKLVKEYKEVYERTKIKEEELKEKNRNSPKESIMANTGKTCLFKRMETPVLVDDVGEEIEDEKI